MIAYDIIRQLREQKHWTQEEMAERLEMSKNGYAKIERGESMPTFSRLEQIASVLGVDWLNLLKINDKNVIVQTQNHNANYHINHYASSENLQAEIEKLQLIVAHKNEIIDQKNQYIKVLERLLQFADKQGNDVQAVEELIKL